MAFSSSAYFDTFWKWKTLQPHCGLWCVCVCVCFPSSLWVARKCSLLVGVLIYHDEIITVHTLACWSSEVSVQSVSLCIEFCADVVSDGCFNILCELAVRFDAAERGRLWISSPHCLKTYIVMTRNLLCTHIWLSAEDRSLTDTSFTAAKPWALFSVASLFGQLGAQANQIFYP